MLKGLCVINMAINLPGPLAAHRLQMLGADVVKVEPPTGDPLKYASSEWYERLSAGNCIVKLDIKAPEGREQLDKLLKQADLLITATRPSALERLGMGWSNLHCNFSRLCHVAIVGYPYPNENEPGHDLTYLAKTGLLTPPQMPKTLIADMVGAEKAASEGLALLLARERGGTAGYSQVALSEAAEYMAEPLKARLTNPGGLLGGGLPEYNIYEATAGWVAVAAIEPHFKKNMFEAFGRDYSSPEEMRPVFKELTADEWEIWAKKRDLPIVALNNNCF